MTAEKPWFPVLIAGIVTTVLTLIGLYFIGANSDFNIMGWYLWFIVPAGAIFVGLLAASGYSVVSWLTGVKIKSWLLGAVLGIQLLAYCVAQYIEYADFVRVITPIQKELMAMPKEERVAGVNTLPLQSAGLKAKLISGETPTFGDYFDESARSMTFKGRSSSSSPSQPVGVLGYGALLLQLVGFVGGSLIAPLGLAAHPFCERCQRYQRGKQITLIPAAVAPKLFKKTDEVAMAAAMKQGDETLDKLVTLAREGRASEFKEVVRTLEGSQKEAPGLPRRYLIQVMSCPGCREGELRATLQEGTGNQQKATELADRRTTLNPDFVKAVTG
jgi:hypothetical protein